jgi:capsular exopolysaccharide synthesis family protein
MGRIDEALRRANLDAAEGTGAEAPAPAPSPWPVEPSVEPEAADAEPAPEIEFDAEAIERLVASKTAGPLLVEQFRKLAATLLRAQGERQLKSVIVTAPSPGDGKSHVAVNLALTLADSYQRRVLLIDADLRRPTLHLLFSVPNTRGLSEALKEKTDDKVTAVQVNKTLTLLPAGRPDPDPLGGLSSGRMKRLVANAASQFDWVIIDSPPVGVLADADLVAEAVDGAILVVRAGVTRYPDLAAAADTLGQERILGLVLNALDPMEIPGEGYYSRYYGGDRGQR